MQSKYSLSTRSVVAIFLLYSCMFVVLSWTVELTLTSPQPPSFFLAYSLRVLDLEWNPPHANLLLWPDYYPIWIPTPAGYGYSKPAIYLCILIGSKYSVQSCEYGNRRFLPRNLIFLVANQPSYPKYHVLTGDKESLKKIANWVMLLGKWTGDMMDIAGLWAIYPEGHAGSCDQWSEHHINKTSA